MLGISLQLMWEIRAFCAVVEKSSFVGAARQLGRSPSAMTRAVQTLEAALGRELLQRSQKLVGLTAAGESYYAYAKQLLQLQDAAEDELASLSGVPQGWIRFSAPEYLALEFLPKVITTFSRQYPEVQFDARFTDDQLDPIQEGLDFAIRGGFPQSSELIGYPLWDYQRYLYASPAYIALRGLPLDPRELEQHDLIMHTAPRILKDWHFFSVEDQYRCKVEPRYRFSSGVAVYHAARAGAGIARLGIWLGKVAEKDGSLVRVCPAYRVRSSSGTDPQMHAVYARGRQPKRVKLFLETIRQMAEA